MFCTSLVFITQINCLFHLQLYLSNQEKFHKEAYKHYWKAIAEFIPREVPNIEKRNRKDPDRKPSIMVIQGPKPGKPIDLSRMRQIFAKLKQNPPAHMMPPPPTKDSKDAKDGKDGKDEKGGKDTKNEKDGKDTNEKKDSKDAKGREDGKDANEGENGKNEKNSATVAAVDINNQSPPVKDAATNAAPDSSKIETPIVVEGEQTGAIKSTTKE